MEKGYLKKKSTSILRSYLNFLNQFRYEKNVGEGEAKIHSKCCKISRGTRSRGTRSRASMERTEITRGRGGRCSGLGSASREGKMQEGNLIGRWLEVDAGGPPKDAPTSPLDVKLINLCIQIAISAVLLQGKGELRLLPA